MARRARSAISDCLVIFCTLTSHLIGGGGGGVLHFRENQRNQGKLLHKFPAGKNQVISILSQNIRDKSGNIKIPEKIREKSGNFSEHKITDKQNVTNLHIVLKY